MHSLLVWIVAVAAAPENVAANVNGEVIRLDEVDAVLRRRPPVSTPLTTEQVRRLRHAVIEGLIDDMLLKQFLRQNGPKVESADVDRLMGGLAAAQRKRGKSLADYFREVGRTEAEVRESWATMLQFQRYADLKATDAELKQYFEANRDFFDNATVSASHIVVRVPGNAPAGERQAARQTLMSVRNDIVAGKIGFAEAAMKHSVCPSARTGGNLGSLTRKNSSQDEPFLRTAFSLKVGDLSEPVDTDTGVHLIRVSAKSPGSPVNYDRIADLVKECFAEELRQQILVDLRKAGTIQVVLP